MSMYAGKSPRVSTTTCQVMSCLGSIQTHTECRTCILVEALTHLEQLRIISEISSGVSVLLYTRCPVQQHAAVQSKPAKASTGSALPSKTPSRTPGTGGKPPAGKTPFATKDTSHPSSAARNPASKGQLTSKLEKSSSTPLVEVVTGRR